MTRPDPATELTAIRADIMFMVCRALTTSTAYEDVKALKQLQTSIVRWVQKQEHDDTEQQPCPPNY
jgi:hypothetical protein